MSYLTTFSIIFIIFYFLGLIQIFFLNKQDRTASEKDSKLKSTSKKMIFISLTTLIINIIYYSSSSYSLYNEDYRINWQYQNNSIFYYDFRLRYLEGKISKEEYDMVVNGPDNVIEYFFRSEIFIPFIIFSLLIVIMGVFFKLYIYPTKVAIVNGHSQANVISYVNYCFGLTLIIWLAMLMWANSVNKPVQQETSLTYKFEELKNIHDSNLISDEEFETKRKELLDNM